MSHADAFRRVAVVGAGAIGGVFLGWLGSRLAADRLQLSALARGETLSALRQQGLRWTDASGASQHLAVRASDQPGELGVQDLVVLCVKGQSLPQVAPAVRALMGPETTVLVAANGVPWWFFDGLPGPFCGLRLQTVDPGGTLAALLPTSHLVGCVVHLSAASPKPACVERVKGRKLIIGEPAGAARPRTQQLAGLLGEAGFEVAVSARIQRELWYKLWGNMTFNPVSALTGATSTQILADPLVRQFCAAVMREAQAIGERIGVPIHQAPEERLDLTRELGDFKTSMLQDVEAGRPIELDALLGAVREIGQHVGLATPHMDALMGLTRLMGQMRNLYPPAPLCGFPPGGQH